MEPTIIAAIITGTAALLAAVISGESKRKEENEEKNVKNISRIFAAFFLVCTVLLIVQYVSNGGTIADVFHQKTNLQSETKESQWSTWSTTPVNPGDTREIEIRETVGYVMNVYVTQEDITPYHSRYFRNFSIAGDFETYSARKSYGEKSYEVQVTAEQLSSATAYAPEDFIPNIGDLYVGGYNKSSETAYVIPIALDNQGRYYPLFIKDEIKMTEYRYRDKN